jgi:hypothetical protein
MLEFLDPRAGHHEPPKFPKARLHLAECMLKKASNTEDYDECIQLLQSIINIEGFEKSDYVVKARLLHQAKARKVQPQPRSPATLRFQGMQSFCGTPANMHYCA